MTRRTLCQDHNGIVHVRSRASHCPPNDAFTLCGRDIRTSSTWITGTPGAPAVLVTCKRCLTEANPSAPRAWGDLFDDRERKAN